MEPDRPWFKVKTTEQLFATLRICVTASDGVIGREAANELEARAALLNDDEKKELTHLKKCLARIGA